MDLAFNRGPERLTSGPVMSVYYAMSRVCHCAVGRERVSVAFVDQVHGGFGCSGQGVCD